MNFLLPKFETGRALALLALSSVFLSHGLSASTSPLSFSPPTTVVGDVTREGYFESFKKLGDMTLNQHHIPVYVVFTTDPNLEPGVFGNFWYLPLFRSKLWYVDTKTIFWRGIDGKGSIFETVNSSSVGSRQQEYESQCGNWLIEAESDQRMIVRHASAGFRFLYLNGDLRSFRLGDNSPIYSIRTYPRSGEMILRENSKRVISVKKNTIRDHELEIEIQGSRVRMQFEAIQQESVPSSCAPEESSFLTSIRFDKKNVEFNYKQLGQNRFALSEYSGAREKKRYEWNLCNGFAERDLFNVIRIEPVEHNGNRWIAPWMRSSVRIWRTNPIGRETYWYENPNEGFREWSIGNKLWKEWFLNSPTNLRKTRKLEVFDRGELVSVSRYAYNQGGRLIRVTQNGNVKSCACSLENVGRNNCKMVTALLNK